MRKIRTFLATTLATIVAITGMLVLTAPVTVSASLFEGSKDQACNGAGLQDEGGCTTTGDSSEQVSTTLKSVLNILSFVVGIIAVIMLIIGGIRFITSQGDSGSTASARNTIIYALVGLIVVVMAQFLVQFVIGRATTGGGSVTTSSTATSTDGSNAVTKTATNGTVTKTTTSADKKTVITITTKSDGTSTTRTCVEGNCKTSTPVK